jgi:signal transduction histidine kinase
LLNLVGNACKFTDRGRIDLTAAPAGDDLVFRVRDTGPGLTAEQCALIFEPFVQVHESADRRRQGSGLGLTLSRQLAIRLGGDLSVVSEPGRGAEFTLRLPLQPAP